jgi:hypothetical protein
MIRRQEKNIIKLKKYLEMLKKIKKTELQHIDKKVLTNK